MSDESTIVKGELPIIQIWEGILVVPLIGQLDSNRTKDLTEKLLPEIIETKSTVTIIDITGVAAIDTHTAQHLIEVVTSIRLLGANAILTGIKPSIAITLVHLGITLEDITTKASLELGLKQAFDWIGISISPASAVVNS